MKTSSLIVLAALACGGVAVAQDQARVQGQAAAGAQTSAAAGQDAAGAAASGSAAAAATAQSSVAQSAPAQSSQGAIELASGTELNAALSKAVDARRSKPGDEVAATVTQDVVSEGAVVIAKGSKLFGHVTKAQPRGSAGGSGRGESQLGIVFDRAVLKDGREVPVHAAIQAIGTGKAAGSGSFRDADAGMAGAGSAAGAARGSGGGLVGGVGGVASGTTAGVAGSVGSSVSGAAGTAGKSAGAVGGFNAAGALTSGSQGVFGMPGLDISSAVAGGAEGSVITSATRNVRLDSGTRMLLVAGANASTADGAASVSGNASASGAANASVTPTQ